MNITEIRVKLVGSNTERLKAFCSVTLDDAIVIRDLKIIEGTNGPFVAMPSRKLSDRCPKCGAKNHLRARFCNECGARLAENRAPREQDGRVKLHADVAHPINIAGREQLQREVIAAYQKELDRSGEPDYQPQHVDFDDIGPSEYDDLVAELKEGAAQRTARRESAPAKKESPEMPSATWSPAQSQMPSAPQQPPRTPSPHRREPPPKPADQPQDPFSAGII
jgi:stage V sporulation protein G